MILRTIFYAILFYAVYWFLRRFLGGFFGTPQRRRGAAGGRNKRSYQGRAVDAEFEDLDNPRNDSRKDG